MIDPKDRWRVELVLAAARWAQNILVEVQGNHSAFIPQETRERLHTAIRQLSEIPHTIPTRIEAPRTEPVRPIDPLLRAAASQAAQAEAPRRALCSSCGAPIVWGKTERGKAIPIDAEPTPSGNLEIVGGVARVVPRLPEGSGPPRLYLSHFATCPQASQHRRGR